MTRLKCLRIATRGSFFFATYLSSGFHEMQRVCLLLEEQLISPVRRYDMRLSRYNPRIVCTPLLSVCERSDSFLSTLSDVCISALWFMNSCSSNVIHVNKRNAVIHSSVSRQVHTLLQSLFPTRCDVVLPLSISSILSFPERHPVAAYLLIFPSLLSFLPSFLY